MNKFLLCAVLLISSAAFSQSSCPTKFTRTNGNNGGCSAHLLLYYASCPTVMPTLDSVLIDGVKATQTFTLIGKTCNGGNSFIEYCVSGNLPPISRITVFMTYPGGAAGLGCTITTGPSAGALPVVLSGFQLQRKGADVFVSWQTQLEINSGNFDIERSYDDVTFEKIGSVVAAGSSNGIRSYSFTDKNNASKSAACYRVKMIDKDGAYTYTEIKSIEGSDAAADFIIFPNPCHGNAKISISNITEPTDVQIMDMTGRIARTTTITNTNVAEINNLKNGTYFVRLIGQISGHANVRKLSVIN